MRDDVQLGNRSLRGSKDHRPNGRPPFECIALLLQGGGALGSYQAGVYEALAEANLHPDWVAGISIGAINFALIAGNAPEARVTKLRKFWEEVTAESLLDWAIALEVLAPRGYPKRGRSTAGEELGRGALVVSAEPGSSRGSTRMASGAVMSLVQARRADLATARRARVMAVSSPWPDLSARYAAKNRCREISGCARRMRSSDALGSVGRIAVGSTAIPAPAATRRRITERLLQVLRRDGCSPAEPNQFCTSVMRLAGAGFVRMS